MSELALTVHGMTCAGCERSIVRVVSSIHGVERVTADRERQQVVVKPGTVDFEAVRGAIEDAGYEVIPPATR